MDIRRRISIYVFWILLDFSFESLAAMKVCFIASGERLAVLDGNQFEGKPGMAMKQSLATQVGVSRFRQRLFWEDGSEIEDDEILGSSPAKVQLLILEFCPANAEQIQQMISACKKGSLTALDSLLRKSLYNQM